MKKVICIGNRFAYPDNFGMKIYEILRKKALLGIELIEGGIGGLNLALHFETDAPILIIDHGVGFKKNLHHLQEFSFDFVRDYNHDTAFYYLLKTLKKTDVWLYLSNDENWNDTMLDGYCEDIVKSIKVL